MQSKMLTIVEAAEYLRIKPNTLRAWAKNGTVKSYKPAKKMLFREIDIELFLKRSKRK